ncbi:ribonuclease H-like domain-containing protein [Tanacetum coccineum]
MVIIVDGDSPSEAAPAGDQLSSAPMTAKQLTCHKELGRDRASCYNGGPQLDSFRRQEGAWISKENNLLPLIVKVECYNCHRKGHFAKECNEDTDPRELVLMVIMAGGMQTTNEP